MSISKREIPPDAEINIYREPVLGKSGLEALAPRIASIFARWSLLEKQLNQMFTLITDADPTARVKFDQLKGWDRRVDQIISESALRLSGATADIVRTVLKLVKEPAKKRDELAHRVWAIAKGFEDELALLPPNDQHDFAEAVVMMKKAGRCDIAIDTSSMYVGSSLVSASDLDLLIEELRLAAQRMESVLYGYLFPEFSDVTGKNFADYRQRLREDSELEERMINVANARRRAGKAARKKSVFPQY